MKANMIAIAIIFVIFKVSGAEALVAPPKMQMPGYQSMMPPPMWNLDPQRASLPVNTLKTFCQRLLDRECPTSLPFPASASPSQVPVPLAVPGFSPQFMGMSSGQGNVLMQPMRQVPQSMPMLSVRASPMWPSPPQTLPPTGRSFVGLGASPLGRSMPVDTTASVGRGIPGRPESIGDDHGILSIYRSLNGSRPSTASSEPQGDPTSPVARMEKLGQVVEEMERIMGMKSTSPEANGSVKNVTNSEEVTYLFGGIDDQTLKEMGDLAHAETKSKNKRSVEYIGQPSYGNPQSLPFPALAQGSYLGYGQAHPQLYGSLYPPSHGPYTYPASAGLQTINPGYVYSVEGYLKQQLNRAKSTLNGSDNDQTIRSTSSSNFVNGMDSTDTAGAYKYTEPRSTVS